MIYPYGPNTNGKAHPTWLDRAIGYVSPEAGARRMAWRDFQNSYKGGLPTRTSEGWVQDQGYRFGSSVDRQQMLDARSRAYQAWENNPVAQALVKIETDNVIGDGLNYQPSTDSEDWNREAKERYYEWLEVASVRGPEYSAGCEIERTLWEESRVAGDVGWILVSRGAESRIQIVPSQNIATPDDMRTDPNVYDGIRFDSFGNPTTFYVHFPDDRGLKRVFTPIAARDFRFLPLMIRSNRARGQTCFMTIFDLLSHLDRYVDGVSLAAWMATVMGIIFKQNNASRQVDALSMMTNSQGDQQRAITFENGAVKFIGTDEEVAQVQAHQPMQQTPEFIRTMLRLLGQPFQMPLEVVALDMSTCTFASARIGLLPFYRHCRFQAGRFAGRWSRTIQWWLSREKQRTDDDPKKWKSAWPEKYWTHELLVNAWDYTDPVSEAQSDQLQIDMSTKSHQMVLAERGRDGERILRERAEWESKTADLPKTHSTLTRDPTPEPAAPSPPAAEPKEAANVKQ